MSNFVSKISLLFLQNVVFHQLSMVWILHGSDVSLMYGRSEALVCSWLDHRVVNVCWKMSCNLHLADISLGSVKLGNFLCLLLDLCFLGTAASLDLVLMKIHNGRLALVYLKLVAGAELRCPRVNTCFLHLWYGRLCI